MSTPPTTPRVTVVIPAYNRSQALRPTIDSVLAQTFTDWELLVVDDGSTDDTGDVVRSCTDPRIRYLRQANAGHSAARNLGLEHARGELLAFLDHDDRWLPEKLARQVQYLDRHPEVVLVYAEWEAVDEDSVYQGPGKKVVVEGEAWKELLTEHNFVHSMSLPLLRTEQVRRVGGFRAEMDICDDLDLFLRLARLGPFGFVPEVLLQYNVGRPDQQSRNITRGCLSLYRCITAHLDADTTLPAAERETIRRTIRDLTSHEIRCQGWHLLRGGDLGRAWKTYGLAVRMRPSLLCDGKLLRDLVALSRASVGAAFGRRAGQS